MRILFCTPVYAPFISGVSTSLAAMAQRLAADGHDVTVLTTNARQATDFWRPASQPPKRGYGVPKVLGAPAQEVLNGVRIERLALVYPWPAPYWFGLLRRTGLTLHLSGLPGGLVRPAQQLLAHWMPPLRGLPEALGRLAPEVDLIHSDDSSWDGLLLASARSARRHKRPLVVRPLMHLGNAWVRAHYHMAHQVAVYRDAAAILALSSLEADAYVRLGIPVERIHRVRVGIEPALPVAIAASDVAGFRQQHALSGPVVAFLGANTYDKGAFTLTKAVVALNLTGLVVNLVCAGPQSEALAAWLRQQPPDMLAIAQKRVHVLGVVDETTKHRLLATCDLLALPSQVDTFGIVFLEAWRHGKPVIGARAGGIPDLVQHEQSGLLVPFDDVEALAVAIRRLLVEPGLAARLGSAGRQLLQHYTWDQAYGDWLAVYDGVLSPHGQGQ